MALPHTFAGASMWPPEQGGTAGQRLCCPVRCVHELLKHTVPLSQTQILSCRTGRSLRPSAVSSLSIGFVSSSQREVEDGQRLLHGPKVPSGARGGGAVRAKQQGGWGGDNPGDSQDKLGDEEVAQ